MRNQSHEKMSETKIIYECANEIMCNFRNYEIYEKEYYIVNQSILTIKQVLLQFAVVQDVLGDVILTR